MLSEFIVRLADLVEAEGRSLRHSTVRVALAIGLVVVATGAASVGLGLLVTAVYLAIANQIGPAPGAAIAGTVSLAAGGVLVWLVRKMAR